MVKNSGCFWGSNVNYLPQQSALLGVDILAHLQSITLYLCFQSFLPLYTLFHCLLQWEKKQK